MECENRKNIMFLMGVYPSYGGVEKVSTILANEFVRRGHSVSIVSFEQPHPELIAQELDARVKVLKLDYPVSDKQNRAKLSAWIREFHVDFLIDQWVVPFYVTRLCKKAVQGTSCKIIAVHHNLPNTNARLKDIEIAIEKGQGLKLLNLLKWHVVRLISRLCLRYAVECSARFLLLCPAFVSVACKYMWLREGLEKVQAMYNPITMDGTKESFSTKDKEIIYVGRVEYNQKRTYRLIDVWKDLEQNYPDWSLTIVGDGPDLYDMKTRAKEARLKRIMFLGFQNPKKYYRRASILLLVSEYEGFGLVLCEAMSHQVVPVVYGSYEAVYDIIENGKTGYITQTPYSKDDIETSLRRLMEDDSLRRNMGQEAQKASRRFNLSSVAERWDELFEELSE